MAAIRKQDAFSRHSRIVAERMPTAMTATHARLTFVRLAVASIRPLRVMTIMPAPPMPATLKQDVFSPPFRAAARATLNVMTMMTARAMLASTIHAHLQPYLVAVRVSRAPCRWLP